MSREEHGRGSDFNNYQSQPTRVGQGLILSPRAKKRRNEETKKRRNEETKKRRNEETKKRRNEETKKRRNEETKKRITRAKKRLCRSADNEGLLAG